MGKPDIIFRGSVKNWFRFDNMWVNDSKVGWDYRRPRHSRVGGNLLLPVANHSRLRRNDRWVRGDSVDRLWDRFIVVTKCVCI